ncbi:hypothetical protein REPUB_Repub20aG0034400 [Reevesia pubescens]
MLIFSARAGNLPELIPFVKASLTDKTVDPYLKLVEDVGLQAVCVKSDVDSVVYGSKEDDIAALESLLAIELDDLLLKETVLSHFMTKFEKLSEVLETARQVSSFSVSPTPIPYDQMKSQCEALVMGKQQKMSVLHSFKHQQEAKATSEESEKEVLYLPSVKVEFSEDLKLISKERVHRKGQLALCSQEYGQNSFRLPPSSPYDKFLKAAGC